MPLNRQQGALFSCIQPSHTITCMTSHCSEKKHLIHVATALTLLPICCILAVICCLVLWVTCYFESQCIYKTIPSLNLLHTKEDDWLLLPSPVYLLLNVYVWCVTCNNFICKFSACIFLKYIKIHTDEWLNWFYQLYSLVSTRLTFIHWQKKKNQKSLTLSTTQECSSRSLWFFCFCSQNRLQK